MHTYDIEDSHRRPQLDWYWSVVNVVVLLYLYNNGSQINMYGPRLSYQIHICLTLSTKAYGLGRWKLNSLAPIQVELYSAMFFRFLNAKLILSFINVSTSSNPPTKRTKSLLSRLRLMYIGVIFTSDGLKEISSSP